MKIRVTYIATIDDKDLTDEGIDLNDIEAIADYFYAMGGPEAFEDYGEIFERID